MAEILVAGLSARALSLSARRAGYAPLAADMFADLDLKDCAEDCVRLEGGLAGGLQWEPLNQTLTTLSAGHTPIGIVCGTGFEDRPDVLDRIAGRWPLLGNSGAAVRRAKDPEILAAACDRLGVPHPELSLLCASGPDWLRKERGGSGGSHVAATGECAPRSYWQKRVPGEPVAALVLGAGERALALGCSAQWADPLPDAPFRYGGAVRPAGLSLPIEAALEDAACRIVAALGLVGLNSVDFLVGDDGDLHLIEINPRPGATLDLFDYGDARLFALHLAACRGDLPPTRPRYRDAAASCIVYARRRLAVVPEFDWPAWTADRQPPGSAVAAGAPLCTVLAQAGTAAIARRMVEERGEVILAALGAE